MRFVTCPPKTCTIYSLDQMGKYKKGMSLVLSKRGIGIEYRYIYLKRAFPGIVSAKATDTPELDVDLLHINIPMEASVFNSAPPHLRFWTNSRSGTKYGGWLIVKKCLGWLLKRKYLWSVVSKNTIQLTKYYTTTQFIGVSTSCSGGHYSDGSVGVR